VQADGRIAIAEAGLHRIVAVAGEGGRVEVLAGSRAEGLRDGPARDAHLAQPSGLTAIEGGAIVFAGPWMPSPRRSNCTWAALAAACSPWT
jgi:hypothetical protein